MTISGTPMDWVLGAAGGALIGLAALVLMALSGRIAGISGILGGVLDRFGPMRVAVPDLAWRLAFLAGLLLAGPLAMLTLDYDPAPLSAPAWLLALAGGLVGLGTRIGSGCTSGHGVCGLARFSARSLVAVIVFMAVAAATVFATRHLGWGGVA